MSRCVLIFSLLGAAARGGEKETVVAVLIAPGESPAMAADLAAVLDVLLAEEPGLVPVERGRLDALMGEQKLRLAGLADADRAARTGRLVQADCMVSVSLSGKGAAFRIVETATAKVLAEGEDEARRDVFLGARMIFEELVRSVRRAPRMSSRLTVGIGAICNQSGTGRSDKLGEELTSLIRARLRREGWAIVLERQYPAPLLAELDLARAGLARAKAVKVPQADVVVAGTFVEKTREFARGLDYPVHFSVTVASGRKGGGRFELELDGSPAELDRIAGQVVEAVRHRRREIVKAALEDEGEKGEVSRLWRAARLLPSRRNTWHFSDGRKVHEVGAVTKRQYADLRTAIRLLENILLIEKDHDDAKMFLGSCLVVLHERKARSRRKGREREYENARRQFARGMDLVYEVIQRSPSDENAAACYWAVGRCASIKLQPHADRVLDFMLANEDKFHHLQIEGARVYRTRLHREKLFEEYRRIVENFRDEEPRALFYCVRGMEEAFKDSPEELLAFALQETRSENPCARFAAERLAARLLRKQGDPAAIDHFFNAFGLRDGALAVFRHDNRETSNRLDEIYREAYDACIELGRRDRARKVAEAGVKRFLATGRMDERTAHCGVLLAEFYAEEGKVREALDLCEQVLKLVHASRQLASRSDYIDLREHLKARLKGRRLPGFDVLEKIGGDRGDYTNAQFAFAYGGIWVVLKRSGGVGPAYCIDPDSGTLRRPRGAPAFATSVAAAGGKVFFGTAGTGLCVIDDPVGEAKLLRRKNGAYRRAMARRGEPKLLRRENGEIPSDHVELLASTGTGPGSALYMAFCSSRQTSTHGNPYGVARLDPETLRVTVLSPSSRRASSEKEPVQLIRDLRWSPDENALWAACNWQPVAYQSFHWQDVFCYKNSGWTRIGRQHWPCWKAICDGRMLHVSAEEHSPCRGLRRVTMKLHGGPVVFRSEDPLLLTARDAAWDRTRLWLATYAGLYEVRRADGAMRCIAHKDSTPVYTVLKDGGWLYLGARDGIYRYRIP